MLCICFTPAPGHGGSCCWEEHLLPHGGTFTDTKKQRKILISYVIIRVLIGICTANSSPGNTIPIISCCTVFSACF